MRAVHWLRTQQEAHELRYWLSYLAYDYRDRSFSNRIYLLYLILFFSVWIFVTLTLFASGGSAFLRVLNPADPARAATLLEVFLLAIWSIYTFWESTKRSPLVFSEEDAALICQMPVSRPHVTMRWFLMPWLESAIPFWLIAITLGFSIAEITMPGAMNASRIFEYAGYGLRAWFAAIPIHLALFSMRWVMGVYRLQKDIERPWLTWLAIPVWVIFFSLLLIPLAVSAPALIPWNDIAKWVLYPIQAGFGKGELLISLLASLLFAFAVLGMIYRVSRTLSLSRAAQETREVEEIHSASRYGFTTYAEQLKAQHRLEGERKPFNLPAPPGAGILIWKDILQSQRSFRLSTLFVWFAMFGVMLTFSYLPDLSSRAFAIAIWVIQIGQVSVIRIRSDLACWWLIRQLPISYKKFLLFELSPVFLLSVIMSLTGLILGAVLFKLPVDGLVILVPGIVAGVVGMANYQVFKRSRCDLLIIGSVPALRAEGVFYGLILAIVPFLIQSLISGYIGFVSSILLSLVFGMAAFDLVVRSYRNIGSP